MTSDQRSAISDQQAAIAAVAQVVDPEIPVLTIEDMGIVRRVEVTTDGVEVDITPTYSGCPAMDRIRDDIVEALTAAGFGPVNVQTVYSPAWTTDWMSEDGRRKLAAYGIAPPGRVRSAPAAALCPRCASEHTREVSEFGSTACKALMVCASCGEPFDRFKEL
jgi:ring-1,2-phenylacetyl-CoA epoxidase subunit PaaD